MRKILIDSSVSSEVKVGLQVSNKTYYISSRQKALKSQAVLTLIDKLLKRHVLKTSDITGIEVNTGPGSFTGLKVGIAIANALGFSLKIPVNKKRVGKIVTPKYEAVPQQNHPAHRPK